MLAHRGGGLLAPENTLAAIRTAVATGHCGVEFDVMLSADGVPVLIHDAEFGRTVPGRGRVADTQVADLQRMDAGSWFDARFTGEAVPRYVDAIRLCEEHGVFMNVEIKPTPGQEARTGWVVGQVTRELLGGRPAQAGGPLFSSFSGAALAAAREAAPHYARGMLYGRIPREWQEELAARGCVALHCDERHLDAASARAIGKAGFGLMCYTVNTAMRASQLFDWGVDAICTDRIDEIAADFAARV